MISHDQQKNAVTWLRFIYPLWAVLGIFSLLYVPSQLIDMTDPEGTVSKLMENELLFRIGIAGRLVTQLLGLAAVWFLYRLFFRDFKEAIVMMAVFSFLGTPIAMFSEAFQLAVPDMSGDPDQAIALLKLSLHGTFVATIFWGLWLFPLGYMIIKSPLFPKFIGWLVILAGFGYLIPAFVYMLGVKGFLIEILDYLTFGEVLWMLWVMILGARWKNYTATQG